MEQRIAVNIKTRWENRFAILVKNIEINHSVGQCVKEEEGIYKDFFRNYDLFIITVILYWWNGDIKMILNICEENYNIFTITESNVSEYYKFNNVHQCKHKI